MTSCFAEPAANPKAIGLKERLQKAITRRERQGSLTGKTSSIKCTDLHSFELGIPLPPLQLREMQRRSGSAHPSRRPTDRDSDTPVQCLYRLYKHVVMRQIDLIEDEVDYFWSRKWEVASIPDPHDKHPERAVVLACCTFLLVEDFNGRITLDLQDDEQSTRDRLEKPPHWALETEPLAYKLFIGNASGRNSVDIAPASRLFLIKNVHIDLTDLGLG